MWRGGDHRGGLVERNRDAVFVDVSRFARELRHGGGLLFGFAAEHLIDREHATGDECSGQAVFAMCPRDHALACRGVFGFEACDVGIDVGCDFIVVFIGHESSVPTV